MTTSPAYRRDFRPCRSGAASLPQSVRFKVAFRRFPRPLLEEGIESNANAADAGRSTGPRCHCVLHHRDRRAGDGLARHRHASRRVARAPGDLRHDPPQRRGCGARRNPARRVGTPWAVGAAMASGRDHVAHRTRGHRRGRIQRVCRLHRFRPADPSDRECRLSNASRALRLVLRGDQLRHRRRRRPGSPEPGPRALLEAGLDRRQRRGYDGRGQHRRLVCAGSE